MKGEVLLNGKRYQGDADIKVDGEPLRPEPLGTCFNQCVSMPLGFEWLKHDPAHYDELDRRRAARRALRKKRG